MKRKRIKYKKALIFADFYSENSVNIWNSTSKIIYTNYLGNYWSNYKGEN